MQNQPNIGASTYSKSYSSNKSKNDGLKHFQKFLEVINQRQDKDDQKVLMQLFGTKQPINININSVDVQKINHNVFDRFGLYLATQATYLNDKTKDIAINTAERFLSAVKNHVTGLLNHLGIKMNFDTADIRKGMTRLMVERCIDKGVATSNPHKAANIKDILILTQLCFWDNTPDRAEVQHFLNSMVQLSGRSIEAATIEYKHLRMYQPSEFSDTSDFDDDQICEVLVNRQKTGNLQHLNIFNHRDNFLFDWYFSLAFSMLTKYSTTPSRYILPNFQSKVKTQEIYASYYAPEQPNSVNDVGNDNNNTEDKLPSRPSKKKSTSKGISKYFKDMLIYLYDQAASLTEAELAQDVEWLNNNIDDDALEAGDVFKEQLELYLGKHGNRSFMFNRDLTSHSQKRFSVNLQNEHSDLRTTWVCLRAGWLCNAIHTIFDYLDQNPKNDRQVARVLSGWTTTNSNKGGYGGGRPPSLYPLMQLNEDTKIKVGKFTMHLFRDYYDVEYAEEEDRYAIHRLLTATLLLRLPQVLSLLKKHPLARFGTTDAECFERHILLQKIYCAAAVANVPKESIIDTLHTWSNIIEADFHRRNFNFVPLSELRRTLGNELNDSFEIDSRTLNGFMQDCSSALYQLHVDNHTVHQEQQSMLQELTELRQEIHSLRQSNTELIKQLQLFHEILLLHRSNRTELLIGNGLSSFSSPNSNQLNEVPTSIMNTSSIISFPHPTSFSGITIKDYFIRYHKDGYYKCWYDIPTKYRQVKSQGKFAIEYYYLFMDSWVDKYPSDQMMPSTEWIKKLQAQVYSAWEKFLIFYEKLKVPGKKIEPPKMVNGFQTFMKKVDISLVPVHEKTGECSFAPIVKKGDAFDVDKIRDRSELISLFNNKKRKRDSDDNEDSNNLLDE